MTSPEQATPAAPAIPDVVMTPVESSNVAAVGHDEKTQTLVVQYKHGGIYHYLNVPKLVHEAVLAAESVGQFLNKEVKEVYQYVKQEVKTDGTATDTTKAGN